jgi:hypothetical protein
LPPCRPRGTSCLFHHRRHPELCCAHRCGGANRCK